MKFRRLLIVPAVVGMMAGAAALGTPATSASAHGLTQVVNHKHCWTHHHGTAHHKHCWTHQHRTQNFATHHFKKVPYAKDNFKKTSYFKKDVKRKDFGQKFSFSIVQSGDNNDVNVAITKVIQTITGDNNDNNRIQNVRTDQRNQN